MVLYIMSAQYNLSHLISCAASSKIPPLPPTFPSLQTLRSLPLDQAAKDYFDSVDSRVTTILNSSDPRKAIEQHLLHAFLSPFIEVSAPLPSLQEAVEIYFSVGRGGLQDAAELRDENAKLRARLALLERLLVEAGTPVHDAERVRPQETFLVETADDAVL